MARPNYYGYGYRDPYVDLAGSLSDAILDYAKMRGEHRVRMAELGQRKAEAQSLGELRKQQAALYRAQAALLQPEVNTVEQIARRAQEPSVFFASQTNFPGSAAMWGKAVQLAEDMFGPQALIRQEPDRADSPVTGLKITKDQALRLGNYLVGSMDAKDYQHLGRLAGMQLAILSDRGIDKNDARYEHMRRLYDFANEMTQLEMTDPTAAALMRARYNLGLSATDKQLIARRLAHETGLTSKEIGDKYLEIREQVADELARLPGLSEMAEDDPEGSMYLLEQRTRQVFNNWVAQVTGKPAEVAIPEPTDPAAVEAAKQLMTGFIAEQPDKLVRQAIKEFGNMDIKNLQDAQKLADGLVRIRAEHYKREAEQLLIFLGQKLKALNVPIDTIVREKTALSTPLVTNKYDLMRLEDRIKTLIYLYSRPDYFGKMTPEERERHKASVARAAKRMMDLEGDLKWKPISEAGQPAVIWRKIPPSK